MGNQRRGEHALHSRVLQIPQPILGEIQSTPFLAKFSKFNEPNGCTASTALRASAGPTFAVSVHQSSSPACWQKQVCQSIKLTNQPGLTLVILKPQTKGNQTKGKKQRKANLFADSTIRNKPKFFKYFPKLVPGRCKKVLKTCASTANGPPNMIQFLREIIDTDDKSLLA